MPSSGVSVVVPARDAEHTLPALLAAAGPQLLASRAELIVVDNGSRDATAELAGAHPAVAQVVRRDRGDGPGPARNAGVAAASGALIAFIDADCRPAENWLRAGCEALADADLVQGQVLPERPAGPFDRSLTVRAPSALFESANLFVRRGLFERLRGFPAGLEGRLPARFGAPFGEDVVFGWRAIRAGARTAFAPEALVWHEVRPRNGREMVTERARLGLFCALAREVPELRQEFFVARAFLSRRTATFDFALAGGLLALLARRPHMAALAAAPYVQELLRAAGQWGRRAPSVAAWEVLADAVGAAALAGGSLVERSVVL